MNACVSSFSSVFFPAPPMQLSPEKKRSISIRKKRRNRKLRIPRYVAWHTVFSRIEWRKKLRPYCFFVSSFCTSLDGQWRVNDWGGIFFTKIRFLGFRIGTKNRVSALLLVRRFWAAHFWLWDNKTLHFILLPISPTPCFPNHFLALHNYEFYLKKYLVRNFWLAQKMLN